MTHTRLWIVGAADPEMEANEALLRECGERVQYATVNGVRVHAGNAYRCDQIATEACVVYLVECAHDPAHIGEQLMSDAPAGVDPETEGYRYWREIHIDHHRPGDPGYGRPPAEFLAASSLGQVIAELARIGVLPESWHVEWDGHYCDSFAIHDYGYPDSYYVCTDAGSREYVHRIPDELVLTAAADHCIGAAYRGECPGVDPDELMRWRVEQRAAFQSRTVGEILVDIEAARQALAAAPEIRLAVARYHGSCEDGHSLCSGCGDCCCQCQYARDMRGRHVPELPEAGTRYGISYIADGLPGPDGRRKVVCSGTADVVRAFLDRWAPANGLVDCYGDPARGFAGGYLTP